jgi:hypothetical protein
MLSHGWIQSCQIQKANTLIEAVCNPSFNKRISRDWLGLGFESFDSSS